MKLNNFFLLVFCLLAVTSTIDAQTNQPPQKTPVELAAEQADRLQIDLKLNDYQVFLIDSVLQANLTGVTQEFDKMRAGGVQSHDIYREIQIKWRRKTEDAFEKILTRQQFERYLKLSGVSSKERKQRLNREKN